MMKNKSLKQKEDDLQQQIVTYLRLKNIFVFAVPNGGLRNIVVATNLKRTGTLAGIPDLIVLLPNRIVIFLEVKIDKGALNASQKAIKPKIEALGFEYRIVRCIDDVKDINNGSI